MALLHPQSCECLDSGLDLFTVPPSQTAVEEGHYVEYHPLAALAAGAPIEFAISGGTGEYIDLSNTFLHVKAKVTKADGTNLDGVDVAPINNWMHSLFTQVDVSLNDTVVSSSENTYAYRAYLETTLNYGKEAKESHLTAQLYHKDTPHHVDETQGDHNLGLKERRAAASRSKQIEMMGRPHSDLFNQSRYLLNGVDLKLKLNPSKDSFNLIAHDPNSGFKTVITQASLFVRKVKLNPAIALAHEKALERGNAKYPMKRVTVKTFSIATGMLSHTQDNLFLSQTPSRIVIGLVESASFNGAANKNPFNFKPFGLSFLSLNLDGRQVPSKALTPDFTERNFVRSYFETAVGLGLINKDAGNDIKYKDFDGGYALYAFDLTPSLLDGDQFELVKSGSLSLHFKFSAALTGPVHVIVYAELDSILEIDRSRQILTDFTA